MPTVEQIIETALSQVGTKESPPNSNRCEYNDWFYGHSVSGANYPWCCVFVSWVFAQYNPMLIKKTAGCADLGNWFKQNNAWHNHTPQIGDVVFFKFKTNARWTNHVGIVIDVLPDGSIRTVEGNTSVNSNDNGGCVMERTRSTNIVGYGRPAYAVNSDTSDNDNIDYVQGVDVSEYQGEIDFDKLKEAGIQFVCMRSTKKSMNPDVYFERNLKECITHRIDYSCYKYAYALDSQRAITEARSVCELMRSYGVKMPIWYDLEDDILISLGKDGIEAIVNIFATECARYGYEVGLYTYQSWYDNYISDALKNKYQFWIARYGKNNGQMDFDKPPKAKNMIAWQYTSKGRVAGINGNVDLDVLL